MSPPNPSPTSVKEEAEEEEGSKPEEKKQVEKKVAAEKAAVRKQENQVEKSQASAPSPMSPIPLIHHFSNLSAALSEFVRQWDGLLQFLDSIRASIDARFKELHALQIPDGEKAAAVAVKEEAKSGREKPSLDEPRAELHSICETMGSRFLRKFVTTHLSELDWLRREIPAALRRAPSPARLVFDSIGRFYLQGSKAYERNPTVIVGRRACILILEFYVLSGLPSVVESSVKQDATVAALAWRSRLVAEGGVKSATAVDALGLALFVASFGIPNDFGCDVMYDLLRLSNLKKKADVFQQSPILREKIPDIIEELLSKDMHVEAVHLACAFGLEEKFPPIPLLSSVLQKSVQTAKEEQRGQSLEVANKKQLAVLKSVVKCVENNKLDPSEIASFNLYQKIATLEKDIAKGKQHLKNKIFKRKAEEVGSLNQPETQAKRPWPSPAEASPGVPPRLPMQTQVQRSPTLSDTSGLYNGLIRQSMYDGGFMGSHYRSGMEILTGGVHGSGVGSSLEPSSAADGAGLTLGNNVGSYANITGGSYGRHQDGAPDERSDAQGYSGFAPSAGWMDPSAAAAQSLFQPQASSLGTETRSSGSNLYRFADIVLKRESDYNPSKSNTMPSTTNPGYYSSYLS
ncbi:LOW QUALITY PROTEIN: protein FRIGIDA [Elaeis guineensis]|uniref:LOW QUALITY PROTEIN: protein FRIGIDA n=1 Tax=Elaeis guineensis var. tenera TaxID=51953 RepID=UPI003C6D2ABC